MVRPAVENPAAGPVRPMRGDTAEPSVEEKVAYLASGRAFRRDDRPVAVVETHTSWVFMAKSRVLKLKKPVRLPFLDLDSLTRREANCRAELRLNRRLAPKVYRRVVALCATAAGQLNLAGHGHVVDWLVEMERLPTEEMLDQRILAGRLERSDITAVALRLVTFYAGLTPQIRDGGKYLQHLLQESARNREVLLDPALGLASPTVAATLDRLDALLDESRPEIEARIAAGRIVEGHGDLRPSHVCLVQPPQFFDCLEFDRNMRLIDPYDEVGYLGMECALLRAQWVRPLLLSVLRTHLGHPPSRRLMASYAGFRAALRARLSLAHLLEPHPPTPAYWLAQAERYMSLAEREVRRAPPRTPGLRRGAAAG